MNRVVVTGMGAVSGAGLGVDQLWRAAREGKSAVRAIRFPEMLRQQVGHAAFVPIEDMAMLMASAKPRTQDRVTILALAAAREAVAQAGLSSGHFGASCGVIVGCGYGGAETNDRNVRAFALDPGARIDPMSIPKIMTNAPASWVGMEFGARGMTLCISTACASATQSIGTAALMIRHGMLNRCLAGGSEALLAPSVFRAWEVLRVMTAGLCRPFSQGRDGMVLGEGAGMLVLELLDSALERGATILAEITGYGTSGDAGDLLRPDPDGAAAAMRMAIADAGLEPSAIAYVNAHGTGTVANEVSEAQALRNVFGDGLEGVLVSSTKPVHGHALGAAGALEFIVSLMALAESTAPPTINFTGVDAAVGIDPVSGGAQAFTGDACLSNSFAFGGINASLVATRFR